VPGKARPIHVVFVHRNLTVGGCEELRLSLLARLDPKKYDVRFVCFEDKGVIGREIERLGYPVDVLGTSDRWFNLLAPFKLAAHLRLKPCTILQSSLFSVNLHARIAARLVNVPIVVCEEHSDYERYNPRLGWLLRPLHRWLARWADRFTVPSEAVKRSLVSAEGIQAEQFTVLYNTALPERFTTSLAPVEARQRLGLPPEGPVIGLTASLAVRKGQIYLLEAMRRLVEAAPGIHCLLVGEGPERPRLEEAIKGWGLEERVLLLGLRRDIPEVLRALDIFVSPAVEEAFGINILEAMLMGLPVVATAVGGVPELVLDEVTGLLVPSLNPLALSAATERLLKDQPLAERMGSAGRQRARDLFGPENYASTLEGLWETLMERKGILTGQHAVQE
jgi:glycosyltransferase involved in cell wall biosynthesis